MPSSRDVAIVTGAAQGIGRGIALEVGAAGYSVALVDLNEQGLVETAAEILASGGRVAGRFAVDVADAAAAERAVATLIEDPNHDGVSLLVNNAGRVVHKPFLEHTKADWDSVLSTNLTGSVVWSQATARVMLRRPPAAIVNIASISAERFTKPHAAYTASKAAVVALTRELACELGPLGIRVNCVLPGLIETPMSRANVGMDEERTQALNETIPVGRWGRPDDVARAVLFLGSSEQGYVNGASLMVSGGADLRAH